MHLNSGWVEGLVMNVKFKKKVEGRVWRLTPVIPTLWDAKAGGSQGQEIETTLASMVEPCLY